MSSLKDLLVQYFSHYSVLVLSIILLLQGIGIPDGATFIAIVSGAFSYTGQFNIVAIFLEVWLTIWLGDCLGYFFWKSIGHKALRKFPGFEKYFNPKIFKAHNYLERHGKGAVFITRFLIVPMAPFVNAAAGIVNYSIIIFAASALMGELLWTGIYVGLGYYFGNSWESIMPIVSQFSEIVLYFGVFVIIVYMILKLIKSKK
ncbi:alkaline phosphatase [Clostridium acetobutylicum]|nr:alkaline phosphatase [Clostridium acetobutylicum]